MHILKTIGGKYIPSFFCIKLEGEIGDDDKSIFEDEKFSTIIHELIHFIQDVSTQIGYINMANNSICLADFYTHNKNVKLALPYKSQDKIKQLNRDVFSIYFEPNQYLRIPKSAAFELIEEENILEDSTSIKNYKIKVKVLSSEECFCFSSISVMEGMAYILENWFYPHEDTHYNFPYDLPVIVSHILYPNICSDIRFVFALCDASLMYYHSADVFINVLRLMSEQKYVINTIKDIYSFVYSNVSYPSVNMNKLFGENKNNAISSLSNILNSNAFNFARDWMTQTINYYYQLRITNPTFISDILAFDNRQDSMEMLINLFKNKGSPIIYDDKSESIILIDKQKDVTESEMKILEYWIVLKEIFEGIFFTGSINCPFTSRCSETECYKVSDIENSISSCIFKYGLKVIGIENFA